MASSPYRQPMTLREPYIKLEEIAQTAPPKATVWPQRWTFSADGDGQLKGIIGSDEFELHTAFRN